MNGRGTRNSRQAMRVPVVLLFVFSALAAGCRDGESGPEPSPSIPFSLNFPQGAQYVYDTWMLDERNPQPPSSKTSSFWHVLGTGTSYQGKGGVTMIADSTSSGGKDTLYLAMSPSGELSIYGFLSRIVKRRLDRNIPERWDLVASFSVGMTGFWKVGPADSLGKEIMYGGFAGVAEYYSANIDGVTEVFPAYRVDLTGPALYYSIWFSNSPNAIVRLLEEPDIEVTGQLRELAAVRSAVRSQ